MTKHTKGPWRVKHSTTFSNPEETLYGGKKEIVEYAWVGVGQIGNETPILSRNLAENEANAQLIAAAPELLEACKAALEVVTDDVIQGLLNEAIAKAEGEI